MIANKSSPSFVSNYETFILETQVLIFTLIFFRKPKPEENLQVFLSYIKSALL